MQGFHQIIKKEHGYKIIASFHSRKGGTFKGKYHTLSYRAITEVGIKVLSNGKEYYGRCKCSVKDQFTKRKGYHIALGRALKSAADDMGLI